MTRRAFVALAAVLVLALPSTLANHSQPLPGGGSITFKDKVGGNEWWVEAVVTSSASVSKVEVMDDSGPWATMTHHPEWASWALSYHVEPGHRVTFRATTSAGTVTSCPFTHPAGVEQCGNQPPPSGWTAREMASFTANSDGRDLAVGDGDGDGRNEVYVPMLDGLYRVDWTSDGWKKARIVGGQWDHVAVGLLGDVDVPHVFASTGTGVHMLTWSGDSWYDAFLFTGHDGVSDLVLGDVDDDGDNEIWAMSFLDGGRISGYDWASGPFVRGTNTNGVHEAVIGDADNDGDNEIFMLQGNRGQNGIALMDQTADGGWVNGEIVASNGSGGMGIAIGDVDHDGKRELYAARADRIDIVRNLATPFTWTVTSVPLGSNAAGAQELAYADPDNNGIFEVYVERGDNHLIRLQWTGTAWTTTDLGALATLVQPLVAGDADNDRRTELHGLTFSMGTSTGPKLLQFSDHPAAPRPPAPPPQWAVSHVDAVARSHGSSDLAVGDGDRDGRKELYSPLRAGLFQEDWTGTAWVATQISTESFERVAVGDVNRDGKVDVYAAGMDSISRFSFDGTGWNQQVLADTNVPLEGFGCLTLGDVDGNGETELFGIVDDQLYGFEGNNTPSAVWRVVFEDNSWRAEVVTAIPGGARACWVGDGDHDGDQDLWVAGQEGIWRVDGGSSGWGIDLIGDPAADFDFAFLTGIVVSDADRDGKDDVFVSLNGDGAGIYRYSWVTAVPVPGGQAESAWIHRRVVQMSGQSGPNDLFAADVDRDGVQELYAPTDAGHLVQAVSHLDGSWNAWDLGEVPEDQDAGDVVLGDVDNDGGLEAYVSAFRFDTCCPSHNVYKFTPAGSPPPPSFDATFTKVTGNEWWIQANVAATGGTLSKVDMRLDGGEWKPLPKQSWGGWAASYHTRQGTIVQMRATSTAGSTDLSDCYRWIPTNGQDAAKVACLGTPPPPPPPPPPPGAVRFSSVGGNEWWVEAVVTSDRAVSGVQVHIDCGAGTAMQFHRDWAKWAVSVHVPNGAKVSFTAFVDGTASKSGGYAWPGATATSGC